MFGKKFRWYYANSLFTIELVREQPSLWVVQVWFTLKKRQTHPNIDSHCTFQSILPLNVCNRNSVTWLWMFLTFENILFFLNIWWNQGFVSLSHYNGRVLKHGSVYLEKTKENNNWYFRNFCRLNYKVWGTGNHDILFEICRSSTTVKLWHFFFPNQTCFVVLVNLSPLICQKDPGVRV